MSWVAAAVVGGAAIGAIGSTIAADKQASAAESAANKQLQATQEGQQLLRDMYAKNAPYWTPYTTLGETGVSNITSLLPYLTQQFGPEQLKSNLSPNYEFMLRQGIGAVKQGLNVGGGGSNITRGATKFAEDYASNAYQQAFNNFQTQRSNIFNTLQNIATLGQTGAAGLSNLGSGVATNVANLGVQGATAIGAGQVGAANAWAGAAQNIGNNVSNAGLLYGMLNPNRSGMVTNTPYTTPSPSGAGAYNVGGAPMEINVA